MDVFSQVAGVTGGAFTSTEAERHGISSTALARAVASGRLRRVARGIYEDPGLCAEGRDAAYVRLCEAVTRQRPGVVLTHHAAAALHGLPVHSVDLARVDVMARRARSQPGQPLHANRWLGDHVVHEVDGRLVVGAAVAVLQMACRGGVVAGLPTADAGLGRGHIASGDWAPALDVLGRCRGIGHARRVALLADGRSESVGESLTRLALSTAGLDVTPQVRIRDGDVVIARVDLLVEGLVVVEFDGAIKYEGATGREALVREKLREDRLRELGYAVVRVTWPDLANPASIVARVVGVLARRAA